MSEDRDSRAPRHTPADGSVTTRPEPEPDTDPDPTPTTTPWAEYLAAAQALDAVRRKAASESAENTRAVSSARAELARARARLDPQRGRLVHEAVQAGVPAPPLDPSPAEQEWARTTVAGGPEAALAALHHSHTLIDATDTQLAEPPARGWWPPGGWLVAAVTTSLTTMLLLCALAALLGLALR